MSDDPRAALTALDTTLDALESALAPLLSQPWSQTLSALPALERAKADVLLAYAINDLVWVYLKSRGLDPASHEVSAELERIRGYYGKVKDAENPGARRTIDKAAAHRFVVAALPSAREQPPNAAAALAARQAEEYVGRASRFKHVAGAAERVTPGATADDDGDVEMGDEAGADSDASAAELLLSVEAEIGARGEEAEERAEEPAEEREAQAKGARRRSGKRKRAEDLA
ncbi:hypothetical protein Q8F55_001405 [Vanrija albida]|uniref:Exosome complex protein n=1 Tax=Vanrija albida TaxID=181172 RepID=A0ABR3QGE5_9TREE